MSWHNSNLILSKGDWRTSSANKNEIRRTLALLFCGFCMHVQYSFQMRTLYKRLHIYKHDEQWTYEGGLITMIINIEWLCFGQTIIYFIHLNKSGPAHCQFLYILLLKWIIFNEWYSTWLLRTWSTRFNRTWQICFHPKTPSDMYKISLFNAFVSPYL